MMTNGEKAFCAVCFTIGVAVPWGLLILAAIISVLTSNSYWGETAAWLAAIGVLWMAAAYLLTHVLNKVVERQD